VMQPSAKPLPGSALGCVTDPAAGTTTGTEVPRVQRAERAQLFGLARCHADCWVDAYRGLVPDSYLERMSDLDARVQRWRPRISDPDSSVHVAVTGSGYVVGEIWVGPTRTERGARHRPLPELELRSLYVRQEWQGSGVAAELLANGLQDQAAWLWVFADNPRAQAFYRKHGFTVTGDRQLDVDTGVDEVRMVRSPATQGDSSSAAVEEGQRRRPQ
jgi:ribosomal protein S18 acetylase RimI-like enzyme